MRTNGMLRRFDDTAFSCGMARALCRYFYEKDRRAWTRRQAQVRRRAVLLTTPRWLRRRGGRGAVRQRHGGARRHGGRVAVRRRRGGCAAVAVLVGGLNRIRLS